jgi:hypothetical protein
MTRRLSGIEKIFSGQCADPDCTAPAASSGVLCRSHSTEACANANEWDQGPDAASWQVPDRRGRRRR